VQARRVRGCGANTRSSLVENLTWMLDTQSDVRLVMRDPETPGGFRLSIAWRPTSRSATADAMLSGTVVADELRAMPQYALQGRRDPGRRCPDMGETTLWRKPVARESRDEKIFPQCGVSFLAALFGTKVQNPFTRSRLVKCTRAKSLRCRYDRRQTSGVRYGTTCAREKLFYCCVRSATRSQDAE
jgi:hypothetical protein